MIVCVDGLPYSGKLAIMRMVSRDYDPNPFTFGTLKWFTYALLNYHRLCARDTGAPDTIVYADVCPQYHLALAEFLGDAGWIPREDVDTYRRLYTLVAPATPNGAVRVQSGTHDILNRIISYYHSYSGRSSVQGYYHSARNVSRLVAFVDASPAFTATIRTTPYFEFNLPDAETVRDQIERICGHRYPDRRAVAHLDGYADNARE